MRPKYWNHDLDSNPNGSFCISGQLDSSLYLHPFSRYLALSILGSRPRPFWVTWRHHSRDHSNPNGPFPIGGPLDPSLNLQPLSRYSALSILGSRPWPFWVTWRHQSGDHSNPNGAFPISGPLDLSLYLLRDIVPQTSCVHRHNAKSSLRMRHITWHVPPM